MSFTLYLRRCICIIITSVLLNGCASQRAIDAQNANVYKVDNQHNQSLLVVLNEWQIAGKLAVITPTERQSAYVNWQQSEQDFNFSLSNLLGISLMSIEYASGMTTLYADDKEYQDVSPSRLIKQVSGWELPLALFPQWIKAQTHVADKVVFSELGLPLQMQPMCFTCRAWQVNYANYKIIDGVWLPHNITLINQAKNTTVKFKISQWKIK